MPRYVCSRYKDVATLLWLHDVPTDISLLIFLLEESVLSWRRLTEMFPYRACLTLSHHDRP